MNLSAQYAMRDVGRTRELIVRHEPSVISISLVFSYDVTAAILVFQNKETAAILVYQTNPPGIEL